MASSSSSSAFATSLLPPVNLRGWIDEHRPLLKPPLSEARVWLDRDFIVSVLGGPSLRKDYHVNPTEELYLQIEGDILVRVIDQHGQAREIPVREGELFLLPPGVPHSPTRPAGSIGLVVERRRPLGEEDQLRFYCDRCGATVYEEQFQPEASAADVLDELLDGFWSDATLRTCVHCGTIVLPPSGTAQPPPRDLKPDLPNPSPTASRARPAPARGGKASSPAPTISRSMRGPARKPGSISPNHSRKPTKGKRA